MKVAVVIPCYNRADTLQRLLNSLLNSDITNLDLVFSIDYSGSDSVEKMATKFVWPFGEKIIIAHKKNIGLRSNILSCGDLLLDKYDRIILLEDDLFVAKDFYNYAMQAADFYDNEDDIAGISLFSYFKIEEGGFNFYPIKDDKDNIFVQWPSSLGQLWTRKHWVNFKEWLDLNYDFTNVNIPYNAKQWVHSWKKYYAAYMVEKNKYFVFPYNTLIGDSGSAGTHMRSNINFNNPIFCGVNYKYRFRTFDKNPLFMYDCFFQLVPQHINIDNKDYFVSFDLYSTKCPENIETDYVITSKTCDNIIAGFDEIIVPFELNIFQQERGNFFYLVKKEEYINGKFNTKKKVLLRMSYSTKDMIKLIIERLKRLFGF